LPVFCLGHNGKPHEHRGIGPRARHAPGSPSPPTVSSSESSWPVSTATRPRSDGPADLGARASSRVASRGLGGRVSRWWLMERRRTCFGVRDPRGFPGPWCSGRYRGRLGCSRSETCAPRPSSARTSCETSSRGELVAIDCDRACGSIRFAEPDPKLCLFRVRLPSRRPDTQLYGTRGVHGPPVSAWAKSLRGARHPADAADMVMPVPESGVPAAQGYARAASGIPYGDGFRERNRYVGAHLHPAEPEATRRQACALKLKPAARQHQGQRSSSWSTTRSSAVTNNASDHRVCCAESRRRVEVHFRVSSPPYRWPVASTGSTPASAPICSRPTCR